MKNKKFCPLPWIFQGLRNNGDIRVCCQANTSKSKGIYRKENGDAFNAKIDSLQESRNSELAKEIRKTMLNNEEHEACIRCDTLTLRMQKKLLRLMELLTQTKLQ